MHWMALAAYVTMALLVTLMAWLKRLSSGNGYLIIFGSALVFTPLPAFVIFLFLPKRKAVTEGSRG